MTTEENNYGGNNNAGNNDGASMPFLSPLKEFGDRYGPYAFGLVSLLMIWFSIVRPELERNSMQSEEQRKIVSQMREIVVQQQTIAVLLNSTSQNLMRMQDQKQPN